MFRSHRPLFRMLLVLSVAGIVALVQGCACKKPHMQDVTLRPDKGVVVRMVLDTGCVPQKSELHKSNGVDHIRWHNPTDTERTVIFTADWLFIETKADIVVPAGGYSAWFTLAPNAVNMSYPYQVEPPLTGPGRPPDEPQVSAGD